MTMVINDAQFINSFLFFQVDSEWEKNTHNKVMHYVIEKQCFMKCAIVCKIWDARGLNDASGYNVNTDCITEQRAGCISDSTHGINHCLQLEAKFHWHKTHLNKFYTSKHYVGYIFF